MSALRFEGVSHAYGATPALEGIDLDLPAGRVTAIMGPSGCGKSTLVALAAGLLAPDRGRVIRAEGRLAVAFQDPALLPWKTARDNVAFALLGEGVPRAERRRRAEAALAGVGLPDRAFGLYPRQLSGGMRQRVALARALVVRPDLLLCDEPFSALDAEARAALRQVLRDIRARDGMTIFFVTHDGAEAQALADRVVVMAPGRIERVGPPGAVSPGGTVGAATPADDGR